MKVTSCFWKYYEKGKETLTANQVSKITWPDKMSIPKQTLIPVFSSNLVMDIYFFALDKFNCVKGKIWTKWLFMTMSKRKMQLFYLLSDFRYYFLSILFKKHISRKSQCFGMIVINQRNWSGT